MGLLAKDWNHAQAQIVFFEARAQRRRLSIFERMLLTHAYLVERPTERQLVLLPAVYDAICECADCRPERIDDELRGTADDLAARALAQRERIREAKRRRRKPIIT